MNLFNLFHILNTKTNFFHIAHLQQECHNSKFVIFQEKLLNGLNCYNFL